MPEVLGIRVEFKLATTSHGYKDVVELLQDGNKTLGELLYRTDTGCFSQKSAIFRVSSAHSMMASTKAFLPFRNENSV